MDQISDTQKYLERKKILPPLWLLISIITAVILHFIFPVAEVIAFPWNLTGIAFLVLGIWLNLRADRLFKKHNTTVKPFAEATFLIYKGPFKFTRNPMYLGFLLILAGIAILLGSLSAFAGSVIFFTVSHLHFIPVEEKMLEEKFQDKFRDYKKKVRRWL